MTEKLRQMIELALDGATTSLEDIAAATGVTYNTLYAWKTGRRNPSPENLARLADALERRGGDLQALADDLRKAAKELEG